MEIVTFEIAKKLKGKSFPQKTAGRYSMIDCFYYENGKLFFHGGACDVNEAYTAPTISQVLKWLREKHSIHVNIGINNDVIKYINGKVFGLHPLWYYKLQNALTGDVISCFNFSQHISYEKAAIAGIEYILDNLI